MSDVGNKLNKLGLSEEQSQKIGERLKNARSSLDLSLRDLSSKIKIQEHYLASMEEGRFDILPTPVHGRGLLRVYAKELKVELPELEIKQSSFSSHSRHEKTSDNHLKAETSKSDIVTPSLHDILGIDVSPKSNSLEKIKEKSTEAHKTEEESKTNQVLPPQPKPIKTIVENKTQPSINGDKKKESPIKEIGKNCLLLLEQMKSSIIKSKRRQWSLFAFIGLVIFAIAFLNLQTMFIKKEDDLDIVSKSLSQNKAQKDVIVQHELSQNTVEDYNRESQDEQDTGNEQEDKAKATENTPADHDKSKDSEIKGSSSELSKTHSIAIIAAPEKVQDGAKEATLNVSSSVDMRIIIDGKQAYSGSTKAGVYNLVFNTQADLFIDDGSCVKLRFGDWDLGTLGHEGRKRRIVLDARENAANDE